MPEVLQTSKISSLLTASIGREVMTYLDAQIGDHIVYYRGDDGRIYIEKVKPNGP